MVSEKIRRLARPVVNLACNLLMYGSKNPDGRSPYNGEELKLVWKALYSQNLFSIDGVMVNSFEKEFASVYGVPYAVASTSGTAAIHTALGALDLNPGDEVITAPITDMGTVTPILLQNAIPVFAEIDETYNIDPASVEQKITKRTRAILAVHLFGNPCNMDELSAIAKRHNIPLIEDCAQAHLTKYKGKPVGTIGDIGCFSFMQSKHMTTGEGGMTITSNKNYYEKMKLFVDKGYARKGWGPRAYLFLAPNYRPTELVGAIGLAQLKKIESIVQTRNELGDYLTTLLSGVPGVTPAPVTEGAKHSYWLYPLTIDNGIDIVKLAKEIMKEKIWVSAGYIGRPIYICSDALAEKKTYGQSQCPFSCKYTTGTYEYKEGLCPRTEEALKHLICMPFDESWTKQKMEHAAEVIKKSVKDMLSTSDTTAISTQKAPETPKLAVSAETVDKRLRIGIVGCGQMGQWHLEAFKQDPRIAVTSFADTDFDKAQEFAKNNGGDAYHSHGEMIAHKKLDGVSICTIPSTHKELTLDFLNAGINVLCEKPLAISGAEAALMVKSAEDKQLLVLPAFKFRFFEEVLAAKELIERGSLGRILSFRLMFGGSLDAAGKWFAMKDLSGGGVVIDNASHAVDLVRYLFGEISSVQAEISTYQKIDVEDTAHISLLLKKGFSGTVDLSWNLSVPSKNYLEIYGEDGTILLDHEGLTYKFKTWANWKRIQNKRNSKEAFAEQTKHFADAILNKKPTIVTNSDGLESQIIIDQIYDSAKIKKMNPGE
jgi:perosamine synthetase